MSRLRTPCLQGAVFAQAAFPASPTLKATFPTRTPPGPQGRTDNALGSGDLRAWKLLTPSCVVFRLLRSLFRIFIVFAIFGLVFRSIRKLLSERSGAKRRPGSLEGQTWYGRVTRVVDGDTIWADFGNGPLRLRFAHIDAPEHGQPFGEEAAAWLDDAIGADRAIIVHPYELDFYGRVIAEVYHGDSRLNYWIVKDGLAWALPADGDRDIAQAQIEAQAAQEFIWTEKYPTPPWLYRKANQQTAG
jgi:micrococcal nuclease